MAREDSYCRRALPRWHTRFGQAVGELGVRAIVDGLKSDPATRITNKGVYEWLRGHQPSPDRAEALVRLSEGRLTLDIIYSHRRELATKRRDREGETEA